MKIQFSLLQCAMEKGDLTTPLVNPTLPLQPVNPVNIIFWTVGIDLSLCLHECSKINVESLKSLYYGWQVFL